MSAVNLLNRNGDVISLVPSVIGGQVASAAAADVKFANDLAYILPKANGVLVVVDSNGATDIITVTADVFTKAMYAGTEASGSSAIAYSYYE